MDDIIIPDLRLLYGKSYLRNSLKHFTQRYIHANFFVSLFVCLFVCTQTLSGHISERQGMHTIWIKKNMLVYFLCKNCNPPEKGHPIFQQLPYKNWDPVKSPLFGNLVGGPTAHLSEQKAGGRGWTIWHTLVNFGRFKYETHLKTMEI